MIKPIRDTRENEWSIELRRQVTRLWERRCAAQPTKPRHQLATEVFNDIKAEFQRRTLETFRILKQLQAPAIARPTKSEEPK